MVFVDPKTTAVVRSEYLSIIDRIFSVALQQAAPAMGPRKQQLS